MKAVILLGLNELFDAFDIFADISLMEPNNITFLSNYAMAAIEKGDIDFAAELFYNVAELSFNQEAKTLELPDELYEFYPLIDKTSDEFREQIFTRVQNNIKAASIAKDNRKLKVKEKGIELIAKALTYLADTEQDISDGNSMPAALSDFDEIKAQLDEDFAAMRIGFQQTDGKIEEEEANIGKRPGNQQRV